MFRDDAPLGYLMALMHVVADEIGLGYILGRVVTTAILPVAFLYFWLRITLGRLTRRFWTRS